MKIDILKLLLLTMMFTVVSCGFPKEERIIVASDTDAVLVVAVPNAGCANCQRIMEGKLQDEKGVKQTILNLHTKEVSIVYEPQHTNSTYLESKVQNLKGILPCK